VTRGRHRGQASWISGHWNDRLLVDTWTPKGPSMKHIDFQALPGDTWTPKGTSIKSRPIQTTLRKHQTAHNKQTTLKSDRNAPPPNHKKTKTRPLLPNANTIHSFIMIPECLCSVTASKETCPNPTPNIKARVNHQTLSPPYTTTRS